MQIGGYFPRTKSLGAKVKIKLNWSNYAARADLKNTTDVETLKIAKTVDLASLKWEINKLGCCKLETTPFDLSKQSKTWSSWKDCIWWVS